MKLRNKKTGEIGNLVLNINPNRESYSVLSTENGDTVCGNLVLADYNSLAELNAEWEDYEESKEYWYIYAGIPIRCDCNNALKEDFKAIGNYFETKEDAEKALEKLKAWKRLKDKGFRLSPVVDEFFCLDIYMSGTPYEAIKDDLKIVFGGEE